MISSPKVRAVAVSPKQYLISQNTKTTALNPHQNLLNPQYWFLNVCSETTFVKHLNQSI